MDDKRIKQRADQLFLAMEAHEAGVAINDSMTFQEAKALNFGRMMSKTAGGKPHAGRNESSNVVDAAILFKGGAR